MDGDITRNLFDDGWVLRDVSVANSYSRGDRKFEKATAMLFPSEIVLSLL